MALAVLVASLPAAGAAAEQGRRAVPDLAVKLSLSARRIAPGEQVQATVNLVNQGTALITVLEPTVLVGKHLLVTGPEGEEIPPEPGLRPFTVKMGLYLGRAVRIPPRGLSILTIFLYLDERRRLFCSALEKADPIPARDAAALDLPADFPARFYHAADLYPWSERGTYRISYRVEQTEGDRSWRRLSEGGPNDWASDLWIGKTESNPVELVAR